MQQEGFKVEFHTQDDRNWKQNLLILGEHSNMYPSGCNGKKFKWVFKKV